MTELLTAAQMRAIEQAAIESGEVTGLELMERAGHGVVEAIFEEWPELQKTSHRAVVLCGPGNNGGDGFVVARLLQGWGWDVDVYLYSDADKLPADARTNYERWLKKNTARPLKPDQLITFETYDIIIDALFGIGLKRPIEGLNEVLHEIVACTNDWELFARRPSVVAIDIASGVCADSGKELRSLSAYSNASVEANLTVTFHKPKRGHFCAYGFASHRALKTVDIGLDGDGDIVLIGGDIKPIAKHHLDHKFDHGHALILSGGAGRTGAARLAARGALRIGAGLVTLGVPKDAPPEVAAHITAEMMQEVQSKADLKKVLKDTRINALCLGPGLGVERARKLVPVAVRAEHAPYICLDADALTAYAGNPSELFEMLHEKCVLTPHRGEFARLFPDIAEKLNAPASTGPAYSKVDATREAAKRAGCTVLFKGVDTVIAAPDGRCSINSAHYERTAPWLATAGSGDVLAGFITGLMARGFAPMQAAEAAAWLHVECARSFGPGLIATDIPEELPKVLQKLEV